MRVAQRAKQTRRLGVDLTPDLAELREQAVAAVAKRLPKSARVSRSAVDHDALRTGYIAIIETAEATAS